MYRLPLAVRPGDGESLMGLVMRNASRHRFSEPTRLLQRLGVPRKALDFVLRNDPGPDMKDRLAALLGLSREELALAACWATEPRQCTVLGHSIGAEHLILERRRACPMCIRETGHDRAIWQIGCLTHCPEHGIPLLGACPTCDGPLRWMGPGLHHCGRLTCEGDLRMGSHVEAAPCTHSKIIKDWFSGPIGRPVGPHGLLAGGCVDASLHLGRLAKNLVGAGHTPAFIRSRKHDLSAVMQEGVAALMDWPRGLHDYLDRLKESQTSQPARHGFRAAFGDLLEELTRYRDTAWAPVIRKEAARHAASLRNIRISGVVLARLAGEDHQGARVESLINAARRLGVAYETMRDLVIQRPDIAEPGTATADLPPFIRSEAIDKLLQERDGHLTIPMAASALGVSRDSMDTLLLAGLICRTPAEGCIWPRQPVARMEIQRFLDRLAGGAPQTDGTHPPDWVPLPKAAAKGHLTLVALAQGIIDGRIAVRGRVPERAGLHGLLVDLGDVLHLAATERRLTLRPAAKRLRVPVNCLLAWADAGLLATTSTTGGIRHVTETALDTFADTYLTAAQLAAILGYACVRSMNADLQGKGVRPVALNPEPSFRVGRLYQRATLIEAGIVTPDGLPAAEPTPHPSRAAAARKRASAVSSSSAMPAAISAGGGRVAGSVAPSSRSQDRLRSSFSRAASSV